MNISKDLTDNTVPAEGQLENSDCVRFHITENADIKIAFLGNSITRHGVAENLGWYGDWGMAASCEENDYVHRLVAFYARDGKRVSFCIANLSEWERSRNMALLEENYACVREFRPDITVVRLGENAGLAENLTQFKPCYRQMVDYFSADGAKVVLTDLFWEYELFDSFVENFAKERGFAFAAIHDLGNLSEMKALGSFAHGGVAIHPGDRGMAEIAARIYGAIKNNG